MTIEREILVAAPPATVYAVVSDPAHLTTWWPDRAEFSPVPGGSGTIEFETADGTVVHRLTVVEAVPPRLFSFRWSDHPDGRDLLVTFEITATATGSRLRLVESGFGDDAVRQDHERGWDVFLPRLAGVLA
jgi:uncharacterized protein YndB with AHSA1/START domain